MSAGTGIAQQPRDVRRRRERLARVAEQQIALDDARTRGNTTRIEAHDEQCDRALARTDRYAHSYGAKLRAEDRPGRHSDEHLTHRVDRDGDAESPNDHAVDAHDTSPNIRQRAAG